MDRYLRTFGADALDLLPDDLWERLVLIRSAPGAGKTSMLRVVGASALKRLEGAPASYEQLVDRLKAMGALDSSGRAAVLGFRVPLSRDFRAIVDLERDEVAASRTFLRLLDARIVGAYCDAVERLADESEKHVLGTVELQPDRESAPALERVGGPGGEGMRAWAERVELELLDRLDSVLPADQPSHGHASLYSIRAIGGSVLHANGQPSPIRPLLLLDDGHELAVTQRTILLQALSDRDLRLARWYTERYSALEAAELIGDGEPGRSYLQVRLEREAERMGKVTRRGGKTRRFEKLLADIAARRAAGPLQQYEGEDRSFVDLLSDDDAGQLQDRCTRAIDAIKDRVVGAPEAVERYRDWFDEAKTLDGLTAARRWRELEILVQRDRGRVEIGLFSVGLTVQEREARSDSAVREAADLFLRREFGLPFYWGPERLSKLSAENIEQYLNLCADLFDEMLVGISLRRGAELSRLQQDAALTAASDDFWNAIPERRAGGREIQQLMRHIARLCREDTYRPTAPYAPGVTGTALSMDDRRRLLDPAKRCRLPGGEQLFGALAAAIGHNLLRAHLDRSVKNDRWMVLYLNRLTCVRYGLPLGYGGFRERSLEEMCGWMLDDVEDVPERGIQESFDLADRA